MTSTENYIGKKIDQFTIEEFIAKGAMGMVYRAFDSVLARVVALKLIPRTLDEGASEIEIFNREEARKRLIQEAKAAGKLAHPNIVTIHSYGETGEFQYICMEYIKGRTLAEIIRKRGTLPVEEALPILEQILLALDAADKEGIVHRDIKPSNIMVTDDGRVKVMDFGIAKLPTLSMTVTGMVLGTPYYMSPEQISGKKVDTRSDIFSLGAVFYELLTGAKPFEGENTATLTYKIVQVDPIPLNVIDVHIPQALWRIVARALAKDPLRRFQHPSEMLREIKTMAGAPPHDDETVLVQHPMEFEETVLADSGARAPAPAPGPEPPAGEPGPKPAAPPPPEEEGKPEPAVAEAKEPRKTKPPAGEAERHPERKDKRGMSPLAFFLILVVAGGGLAYWLLGGTGRDPGRTTTATSPPVPATRPPATAPLATPPPATTPPATVPPVTGYPVEAPPADTAPAKPSVETLLTEAGKYFTSNPDLAQKLLEEALALDPGNYYSTVTMARLLAYRKDYAGAIPYYRKAVTLNNRAADAFFELGSLYVAQSEWNAAIQAFESSLSLSPSNRADILASLGYCLSAKGHSVQAQIYLRQSLELEPNNVLAKTTMANLQNATRPATRPTVPPPRPTTQPPRTTPPPPAAKARLEGNYTVSGTNPNGTQYKGAAVIRRSGDRYVISWNIAGQSFSGSGTLVGRILTVHWKGPGGSGIVIYGVTDNGTLRGKWSKGQGTETLTPVN